LTYLVFLAPGATLPPDGLPLRKLTPTGESGVALPSGWTWADVQNWGCLGEAYPWARYAGAYYLLKVAGASLSLKHAFTKYPAHEGNRASGSIDLARTHIYYCGYDGTSYYRMRIDLVNFAEDTMGLPGGTTPEVCWFMKYSPAEGKDRMLMMGYDGMVSSMCTDLTGGVSMGIATPYPGYNWHSLLCSPPGLTRAGVAIVLSGPAEATLRAFDFISGSVGTAVALSTPSRRIQMAALSGVKVAALAEDTVHVYSVDEATLALALVTSASIPLRHIAYDPDTGYLVGYNEATGRVEWYDESLALKAYISPAAPLASVAGAVGVPEAQL
jgi:hypothetical protein